jgi:prevent-host-death family protein
MKTISAAEANRHFSSLLRQIASGESVTIVSRGRPVATMSPAQQEEGERANAKQNLLARLRSQRPSGARDWSRDELYDV